MKLRACEKISYEDAKQRILKRGPGWDGLYAANHWACVIWPGNDMTSQGAGGAASRILKRMQAEGLAEWDSTSMGSGWRIKG